MGGSADYFCLKITSLWETGRGTLRPSGGSVGGRRARPSGGSTPVEGRWACPSGWSAPVGGRPPAGSADSIWGDSDTLTFL